MVDHRDLAERAFDASQLPDPPRTGGMAFAYLNRLLAMLPAAEQAGYVKAPAGGENLIALPDGRGLVRTARVIYPDGQIYKVMNDVPNGTPQWEREDVRPELYVPFTGAHVALPDTDEPPAPDDATLEARVATLEQQLKDFVNWTHEVTKQIGEQNKLQAQQGQDQAALTARVAQLEPRG